MDITHKRLGLWGVGVSGSATLSYLLSQKCSVSLLEKKCLSPEISALVKQGKIKQYQDPDDRDRFFAEHDLIIPSPGIDTRPFQGAIKGLLVEADLFAAAWHKPIIAVTGTIGKTSITTLLSQLLKAANIRVATGGNIGTGMLELINEQTRSDYALLELSSFQLEHIEQFAPSLAILTNCYPNHLDRHNTFNEYLAAKLQIITHMKEGDVVIAPLSLAHTIRALNTKNPPRFVWITTNTVGTAPLRPAERLYYIGQDGSIWRQDLQQKALILSGAQVPPISFPENWLVIATALDILKLPVAHIIANTLPRLEIPHNRVEPIATIDDIEFYNDSKATVIQATLAAVESLQPRTVHLLLGGLSKGADRHQLIPQLKNKVASITCFGTEADALAATCHAAEIVTSSHATLDAAFAHSVKYAQAPACILLSPGGSSYDLYANYEERGAHFAELVQSHVTLDE